LERNLTGESALITGATSGIGRSVALRLAGAGAEVIIHGRDATRGAEVIDDIHARGGRARFVPAALESAPEVLRLAEIAAGVSILVNNAGIAPYTSTQDASAELFDALFALNVRAPSLLVGALGPRMAARGHGAIVNVSSAGASRPVAKGGFYGASKAALEMLTQFWADEYGSGGVRVNAIAPGPTATPATMSLGTIHSVKSVALGRMADPDEIASVVHFLVSAESSYVTGAVILANGGFRVRASNRVAST
jgi:NAD(P)-dependent dehydrogenase (short-subunit alcohol dehydrogenase family)